LTLVGADEDAIRIGDRFTWGPVELEVSQPRAPCFKFTMLTGREDMSARMTVSGRTGWYFRVLKEGLAPTSGELQRTSTDERMPSIHEAFVAVYHPRVASDIIEKVLVAPALSFAWRNGLLRRLKAAGLSEWADLYVQFLARPIVEPPGLRQILVLLEGPQRRAHDLVVDAVDRAFVIAEARELLLCLQHRLADGAVLFRRFDHGLRPRRHRRVRGR